MQRLFSMCLEAGIASFFLIPAFWSLNRFYFRNANRAAVCLVFSLYLAAVDAVAGLPCLLRFRFDRNLNLKPFAYLFSDFESSFLNVLLFIPPGTVSDRSMEALPVFSADDPVRFRFFSGH